MELDRLSVHATATRYPSPTGRLSRAPGRDVLEREIQVVTALLERAGAFLEAH